MRSANVFLMGIVVGKACGPQGWCCQTGDLVLQVCKSQEASTSLLTALRAGPPFSWGVISGGPPGGRSLSKDGTRADSAKDFAV